MLDAKIASALKKLINTQSNFWKRSSVEEQRAQSSDRFLRGRPNAYMIYEHFRATRVFEAVQGLADLVSMILRNEAVQDFDVLWDHALSAVSEMPSSSILEGLYKSKLQNSAQLQTVMALHDQEVARNDGTPNYQQLKTAAKLHIDQMMRNRNFRAWMFWNEDQLQGVKMVEKTQEKKVSESFQWKAQGQCSKGDSCSFSHEKQASEKTKDDRLLPPPTLRQNRLTEKMTTKRKILTREVSFCVVTKIAIIRRVSSGILPCV